MLMSFRERCGAAATLSRRAALALPATVLGHRAASARGASRAIAPEAARATATAAEERLDDLLGRHVVSGPDGIARVAYGAWKSSSADVAALEEWIATSARRQPSSMARAEAFAFWANLYNALTLQVVLANYPVRSIRDIRSTGVPFDLRQFSGPWRTRLVTVEQRRLSLDDIEHGILRPQFRDPRVHYAVNCASLGCPDIGRRSLRAATLDAELDAAARRYVNHPRGVSVGAGGRLRVSSIYRWFREDFGGDDAGVVAHLRRYAMPPLATALAGEVTIAEDGYDWSLNDAAPIGGA